MKRKLKALIYARVSTIMQDEKDSLIFQKKKCEDFCNMKGYEIYKILEDVESGANDDRDGFIQLQKEIEYRNFDILVVYESSRISRKTLTMLNFVLHLEENAIKFISISQPELDTTTPTGMLFFQIQASLGEYERKQISSRVKSSKFQRAKEGIWQGGTVPIGYKKQDKKIVIDEKKANQVKSMFYYFLSTLSLRETAKHYNKPIASIKWILQNPFYLGKLPYGKKNRNINTGVISVNKEYHLFEGRHEAIISQDLFNQVQKALKSSIRYNYTENKLLFTGMIRCLCGGKLYKKSQMDKNTLRTYYSCNECKKSIAQKRLEKVILNELLNMKELEELNNVEIDNSEILKKILSFNKELGALESKRNKYADLYSREFISMEEFEKEITNIKVSKIDLKNKIKTLEKELEDLKSSENYTDNLNVLKEVIINLEDKDRMELHKIFKLLIKKIVLLSKEPLKVKIYIL